jgi:hypothetical protein
MELFKEWASAASLVGGVEKNYPPPLQLITHIRHIVRFLFLHRDFLLSRRAPSSPRQLHI